MHTTLKTIFSFQRSKFKCHSSATWQALAYERSAKAESKITRKSVLYGHGSAWRLLKSFQASHCFHHWATFSHVEGFWLM